MYTDFTTIYEEKIKEDINYIAYAEFIIKTADKYNVSKNNLLDIGAGTGLASYNLQKIFKKLTLAEPSEEMLMLARDRFEPPYIPEFINAGAESLIRSNYYDVATAAYDVFNYLEDDTITSVFKTVFEELKKDGLFIFDYSTRFKLETKFGNGTFVYDDDDYFHVWENQSDNEGINITINAFKKVGGLYQRITEEQKMRFVDLDVVTKEVKKAGFTILDINDDYTDIKNTENTLRTVFVLRKEN